MVNHHGHPALPTDPDGLVQRRSPGRPVHPGGPPLLLHPAGTDAQLDPRYNRAESIAIEVPSENLEPAIRLVVETFVEPRFSPEDLAKEKTLLAGSLATAVSSV